MTTTGRAIGFAAPGAPFAWQDHPLPAPGPGELLLAVEAIALNPIDLKQHAGAPRVLGVDAAGRVLALGEGVAGFAPGMRVACLAPPSRAGSYASHLLVDARMAAPVPDALPLHEAAALPCAGLTAHEALFERLRIGDDATLLVVGGAGGVGGLAVQLARALTRARVAATASRPESRERALALGAHAVLDHGGDMAAEAKAQKLRFTHILSPSNTAANWEALLAMLAPRGSICLLDAPDALPLAKLRAKGAGLCFEAVFAKALFSAPDLASQGQALGRMLGLLAEGRLGPLVTRQGGPISPAAITQAHEWLATGHMLGKAVLSGW